MNHRPKRSAWLQSHIQRLLRPATPATPGGVTTLAQRDIYILPTRHGMLFALVLVAMLLGAMNYNNNLGFLLTFLLGSMGLVSILHTYRNLAGLEILGAQATSVHAGERAPFQLAVRNRRPAPRSALSVYLEDEHQALLDIPPDTTRTLTIRKSAPRRGRLPLGRLTLESRYPLGLFRAWTYLEPDVQCIVYPKAAAPQPLPSGSGAGGAHDREDRSGVEDFRGFRDYHFGDSPRHIYWKALAREQGLCVKEFADSQSETLWLEWDRTQGAYVESRLSQLCRWVLDASRSGQPFGIRLPSRTLAPAIGEEHVRKSLTALALFEP